MPKIESAMIVPQAVWNRLPLEVGAALAEHFRSNGGYTLISKESGEDCDADGRLHDLLVGILAGWAWARAVKAAQKVEVAP